MKISKKEEFYLLAKQHNILLLEEYKGNLQKIKAKVLSCGHRIHSSPKTIKANIKNGGSFSCPKCSAKSIKTTREHVRNYVSKVTQKEYKVVSMKGFKTVRDSKIMVYHKTCGNIFPITFSNFKIGRRCPVCAAKSTNSKADQLIKRLFNFIGIEYESEKTFQDLINPFTESKLRFDIYIPKLNMAIEIDGEQHVIPIERFGGEKALLSTQYRDYLKNKYCLKNNIKLIRIPLYMDNRKLKYEEVKKIIFNLLLKITEEYF